jgi:hypothetical protein
MGTTAAILGGVAALCAVFGILIAADVVPSDMGITSVGWTFWFFLSALLFLASITVSVGSKGNTED